MIRNFRCPAPHGLNPRTGSHDDRSARSAPIFGAAGPEGWPGGTGSAAGNEGPNTRMPMRNGNERRHGCGIGNSDCQGPACADLAAACNRRAADSVAHGCCLCRTDDCTASPRIHWDNRISGFAAGGKSAHRSAAKPRSAVKRNNTQLRFATLQGAIGHPGTAMGSK